MSNTLIKLRDRFLEARKARDASISALLSTIIGEIESKAVLEDGVKTVKEEITVQVLKAFVKRNEEFAAMTSDEELSFSLACEKVFITNFLPQQLSEPEIKAILIGTGIVELGRMMAYLKEHYAGCYDGKIASRVAREVVQG
jgi:uncharacterized protein YqeY